MERERDFLTGGEAGLLGLKNTLACPVAVKSLATVSVVHLLKKDKLRKSCLVLPGLLLKKALVDNSYKEKSDCKLFKVPGLDIAVKDEFL